MKRCPDPTENPDYCDTCRGWGHKCSEWLRTHPERAAEVKAAYLNGFDPTRFYASTAAAQAGEFATAMQRRRKG